MYLFDGLNTIDRLLYRKKINKSNIFWCFSIFFLSRNWKVRHFTDAPDDVIEPVQHFAQIGPPRNLTVNQADTVYEFVVSWYPPEYGLDTLR